MQKYLFYNSSGVIRCFRLTLPHCTECFPSVSFGCVKFKVHTQLWKPQLLEKGQKKENISNHDIHLVFNHLGYQFQNRRMSWQLGWGRVCGMIDSFKYPLRGVKVSGSCWIKECVVGGCLGACGRDDEVQTNQVSMTVHYNMANKQTHHVAHIQCMRAYQQETLILIPPPLTCITLTLFNIINSII